jgi:hypothetical protein
MHELHQAVTFMGCVGHGLAQVIPWKVVGSTALVAASVFFGTRRSKK